MNPSLRFDRDVTDYPAVRRVMGPERMRLDDEQLEDLLGSMFPESDAEDLEDFMRGLQSLGRQVAPLAQRALPGVLKGATSGAAVAGPWGAIAGGIGGGAASLLGGQGVQTQRSGGAAAARPAPAPKAAAPRSAPARPTFEPPPAAPTVAPPAAAPILSPVATSASITPSTAALPAASPPDAGVAAARPQAAAQLLALLSRPETTQALLALLMADAGKPVVKVGANAVPAQAFAGAIAELAAETAAAWSGPARDDYADYLLDSAGEPRGDIYNPAARAALLLGDLAEVAEAEAEAEADFDRDRQPPSRHDDLAPFATEDHSGNAIDSYEAALNGRSDDE